MNMLLSKFSNTKLLPILVCMLVTVSCGDDDPTVKQAPDSPIKPVKNTVPDKVQSASKTSSKTSDDNQTAKEQTRRHDKTTQDKAAYYADKKTEADSSPFNVKVDRIYLEGACHKGNIPSTRRNASGVKAVMEGSVVYTGDDLLYDAKMQGAAYLRFGAKRFEEASAQAEPSGRTKAGSKFLRRVRGADPWFKGQQRLFHWESHYFDEVFCETKPDEAVAYVELDVKGVRTGHVSYPIKMISINWDEVLGMSVRQQVAITGKIGGETITEPADAHYSKLNRILVTRLTGQTAWIARTLVIQNNDLDKGPAAIFPAETASNQWKVSVTGIEQAKEFGGYANSGEDQFLAIVNLKITYIGDEAGSLSQLSTRLETSPGRWQRPLAKAMGQLDTTGELESGVSIKGKLVFPKQRFERPFRLEIRPPDGEVMYIDVLSYDIGPTRQ